MNDALNNLSLFACDRDIAIAVVGKSRADMWMKTVIPQLERKGFPKVDPLHDGRPVPLVKKFYDGYFGITAGSPPRRQMERKGSGNGRNQRAVRP